MLFEFAINLALFFGTLENKILLDEPQEPC